MQSMHYMLSMHGSSAGVHRQYPTLLLCKLITIHTNKPLNTLTLYHYTIHKVYKTFPFVYRYSPYCILYTVTLNVNIQYVRVCTSYVICPMSYVVCHMSYVICHMSYVICHMSYVVCHVVCHILFMYHNNRHNYTD
jgi:hypothetical protein